MNTIKKITLDERTVLAYNSAITHERNSAISDLLTNHHFQFDNQNLKPPYDLHLSQLEGRLAFQIQDDDGHEQSFKLSMQPLRRIIRDYFTLCESYQQALNQSSPYQLETIDMSRRSLHNEGSDLLTEHLERLGVTVDQETSRRLFTLICILHIKPIGGGQHGFF